MDTATRMADERPFKMDSEGKSAALVIFIIGIALAFLNCIGQPLDRSQWSVHGSGDGGWKITRPPMPRQQVFDRGKRVGGIIHHVISGATVNVKIEVTGRDRVPSEVNCGNSGGKRKAVLGGQFDDA